MFLKFYLRRKNANGRFSKVKLVLQDTKNTDFYVRNSLGHHSWKSLRHIRAYYYELQPMTLRTEMDGHIILGSEKLLRAKADSLTATVFHPESAF